MVQNLVYLICCVLVARSLSLCTGAEYMPGEAFSKENTGNAQVHLHEMCLAILPLCGTTCRLRMGGKELAKMAWKPDKFWKMPKQLFQREKIRYEISNTLYELSKSIQCQEERYT